MFVDRVQYYLWFQVLPESIGKYSSVSGGYYSVCVCVYYYSIY